MHRCCRHFCKEGETETLTTVQRERVDEAAAGQEDADQEGRDDHVDKASQDKGVGAARVPESVLRPVSMSSFHRLKSTVLSSEFTKALGLVA